MFKIPSFSQINKVCENIKDASKEFLDMFPEEIQNKFKDNFYLAGGCIYSLYNDKEPNDYDIFVHTEELKNNITSFFINYITEYKHGGVYTGYYNGNKITKSKYAITIGNKFQRNEEEIANEIYVKKI